MKNGRFRHVAGVYMARREKHQTDPLLRFTWRTRKRMAAKELDSDLGTLLLSMAEEFLRETPEASGMLRALQARFIDLYGRLEDGSTADLMTHSRGVSQLDGLQRSIRLAVKGAGRRRVGIFGGGLPSAPRKKTGIPTGVTREDASGSTTEDEVDDEVDAEVEAPAQGR